MEIEIAVALPCETIDTENLPGYAVGDEDIVLSTFTAIVRTSDGEAKRH